MATYPTPASPVPTPEPPSAGAPLITAGAILIAIGTLYFGRDIIIPFALAVLLAFALAPLVLWLRRLRLPRIAAVLVAVFLAFLVIGALSLVVVNQVFSLAGNLPTYQQTIQEKIRSLRESAPKGGVVERVSEAVQEIGKELQQPEEDAAATQRRPGQPSAPRDPVRVTIEQPMPGPLEILRAVIGPLLTPIATAGLVIVFVIFILLEREDLRDRFIGLVGAGDIQRTTEALNEAARRVSRYLLVQLIINLAYGIPLGIGLYFIGIPNALLWGLLAAVLRFIPYLGPFLAALFPIALSIAVDPGWTMLAWTVALFLVMELVSNNVVEPWLYGASTGLSSLAIIMAAIFWTTLWGPVGLFLSTPLTVCVVVIGRYVPRLEFLGVLLGSDPVLAPEQRLYQRLLAENIEEAIEIAEDYVEEKSLTDFFETVAIPTLRLAENDRRRGVVQSEHRRLIAEGFDRIFEELEPQGDEAEEGGDATSETADDQGQQPVRPSVLCVAGRGALDGVAARIAAENLERHGIVSRVLPPLGTSREMIDLLDLIGVEAVCLCYLQPNPQPYARYICRRLKRRSPQLKIIVTALNLPAERAKPEELLAATGADAVTFSVAEAVTRIRHWTSAEPSDATA